MSKDDNHYAQQFDSIESEFEYLCATVNDGDYEYLHALRYSDFLLTDYWDTLRRYRLYTAGYVCELCGADAKLDVHHKTYDHHGEEHLYLGDLIVVCRNCHDRQHHTYKRKSELLHITALRKLPPVLAILFGGRR